MEKSIMYVDLMNRPAIGKSNRENYAYRSWLMTGL
jgi:hypothetical protein